MAASPGSEVATKNILVATDFCGASNLVLDYAALLARHLHARILLTHVLYAGPVFPFEELPPAGFRDVPTAREDLELAAASRLAGIEHELLFRHGDVCTALKEVASENRVDFVVVATHGRKGIRKLLAGSVSEHVLRCARCPVLTVGRQAAGETLDHGRVRDILVATDFSPACKEAFALAQQFARADGGSLAMLHVTSDESDPDSGATADAMKAEAEQVRTECGAGKHVEVLVQRGDVAETIVRIARERKSSMIAMGLHREPPLLASHLGWTTAHRVIVEASCPVLAVPSGPGC